MRSKRLRTPPSSAKEGSSRSRTSSLSSSARKRSKSRSRERSESPNIGVTLDDPKIKEKPPLNPIRRSSSPKNTFPAICKKVEIKPKSKKEELKPKSKKEELKPKSEKEE